MLHAGDEPEGPALRERILVESVVAMGGRIRFLFQAGMFDIEPRRRQRIRQGLKAFEQEFIRVAHADNFDFSKQACSTTSRVYRSDARNTLLQSGAQAHNIGPM